MVVQEVNQTYATYAAISQYIMTMQTHFSTQIQAIIERVDAIDPVTYASTRNYVDGAVTRLSPYISRGVISTRFVLDSVLRRGYQPVQIEKFIQELAWRDFFQRIWQSDARLVNTEVKHPQKGVTHHEMPLNVVLHQTGIVAIDKAIRELYETGYMHNHVRMYVASMVCNVARSHWKLPARWLYYHLLDGDLASNNFSWQWVAGSFSNKKYVANQENMNKFCRTRQQGTFMDVSYDQLPHDTVPEVLRETTLPALNMTLPETTLEALDQSKPTLLYNWYNLDPYWYRKEEYNRILLIEPGIFQKYPISKSSMSFMLGLAKNIPDIKIFTGEFAELATQFPGTHFIYKEHPLNRYQGSEEPREFLNDTVTGYHKSFFAFWKKLRPELL